MAAIGLDIEKIVDDVGGRSAEAEAEKGHESIEKQRQLQGMGQQKGNEDENILCPLMQANRFEEDLDQRGAIIELAAHRDLARFELCPKGKARIGDHGLAGLFQQRQIGRSVADVVESIDGKSLLEAVKFIVACQVSSAVTGQHLFENSQVVRNAMGQSCVSTGGEIKLATLSVLLHEVFEQRAVIGQMGGIEL